MVKPLGPEFLVETPACGGTDWDAVCRGFSDANLYQTLPYGVVRSGASRITHLVVKRQTETVAAVQSRIGKVPVIGLRVAYSFWGPMWQAGQNDLGLFRCAVRALRNEYVVRQGMVVRLRSNLFQGEHNAAREILAEEGFIQPRLAAPSRTIIMDIRPSLDEISRALHQKWRNCLNAARKRNLEIIEGEDDSLFEAFGPIHEETQERKGFVEGASLAEYRLIQKDLSPGAKMRVVLCKSEGKVCAGAIGSAMGDTGIYLFGATSNDGMKAGGSYLAQWKMIEWLKQRGCHWYNLNGINPVTNEGTYRFKSRLAGSLGRDVYYLGQFDAYPNSATQLFVGFAERLRNKFKAVPKGPAPQPE
jgi:hypothetical protein